MKTTVLGNSRFSSRVGTIPKTVWFGLVLVSALAIATACSGGSSAPSPSQKPPVSPSASDGRETETSSPGATLIQSVGPTAMPTSAVSADVGPEAVWHPDIQDFQGCQTMTCRTNVMEQSGASPEAIRFYKTTGWFLTDFIEMGQVDLGVLLNPFKANSNYGFALLNGSPSPVMVGRDATQVGRVTLDPAYSVLASSLSASPGDLAPWKPDAVFESETAFSGSRSDLPSPRLPNAPGQRFIFQFPMNNGCHACGTGYAARYTFDFISDGTYADGEVLGLCRSTLWPVEIVIESIPECPPLAPYGVP